MSSYWHGFAGCAVVAMVEYADHYRKVGEYGMRNRNNEPSFLQALVVTILLFLLIPLPFALYLSGTEWIVSGWHGIPKEFIASYAVGAVVFIGGLIYNQWCTKDKRQ